MSQPVKLSEELVIEARTIAAESRRSIAGQVEFWARLGRAVDPLLRGDRVLALQRSANDRLLSDAVSEVDCNEGRKRVHDYLESRTFPHFEPDPESPGTLVMIDKDGTRTRGRFVNRDFVAEEDE